MSHSHDLYLSLLCLNKQMESFHLCGVCQKRGRGCGQRRKSQVIQPKPFFWLGNSSILCNQFKGVSRPPSPHIIKHKHLASSLWPIPRSYYMNAYYIYRKTLVNCPNFELSTKKFGQLIILLYSIVLSFVPSAITQPFFELQTPDFAWKFVWIVQINYKSTKV